MNEILKTELKLELLAHGIGEDSALHEDLAAILASIEGGRMPDADALADYDAADAVALQEALNLYRLRMQARADAAADAIGTIAVKNGIDTPPPEGRAPADSAKAEQEQAHLVMRKFFQAFGAIKTRDAKAGLDGFQAMFREAFGAQPDLEALAQMKPEDAALTLWRNWRRGERIIAAAQRLTMGDRPTPWAAA